MKKRKYLLIVMVYDKLKSSVILCIRMKKEKGMMFSGKTN